MDLVSKLGYSSQSPFRNEAVNTINSAIIDMRNTRQPLVGINNGRAGLMKPGATYNTARKRTKFEDGGMSTTEVPMDLLFSLEPLLLEAHLKTLSTKDKNVFMERYMPLADNMRRAALMQIAAKYPDVLEDFQEGEGEGEMENDGMEYQYGGPIPTFSPLQTLVPSQESLSMQPLPTMPLDVNPYSEDNILNNFRLKMEETPITKAERDAYRLQKTQELAPTRRVDRPLPIKMQRERRNGGDVSDKLQGGGMLPDAFEDSPWTLVGTAPKPKNMTPVSQGTSTKPSGTRTTTKKAPTKQTAPVPPPAPVPQGNPVPPLQRNASPQNSPGIAPLFMPSNAPVSNTTAAIANVTGDPIYTLTTTNMRAGRAQSPGLTPTPWYALDTNRPTPSIKQESSYLSGVKPFDTVSQVKLQNNPLMPPKAVTDRFTFISRDRSGQWENVLDPVTNTRYRRDVVTGQYFEGFSSNPDRTEQQQMEMNKLLR